MSYWVCSGMSALLYCPPWAYGDRPPGIPLCLPKQGWYSSSACHASWFSFSSSFRSSTPPYRSSPDLRWAKGPERRRRPTEAATRWPHGTGTTPVPRPMQGGRSEDVPQKSQFFSTVRGHRLPICMAGCHQQHGRQRRPSLACRCSRVCHYPPARGHRGGWPG